MPSPVGHALGGAIVGLALGPRALAGTHGRSGVGLAALSVLACLPDVDFLWGRHNAETHSLGAAVLVGLAVLAVRGGRKPRLAVAATLAWGSHVLFDWLGADDTPPLGVMALWPLTDTFHFAHAYVFDAISRRYWLPGFAWHNAAAVARELALLAPIVVLLAAFRRRHPAVRTPPPLAR